MQSVAQEEGTSPTSLDPVGYTEEARLLMRAGRPAGARAALQKIRRYVKDDASFLAVVGRTYMMENRWKMALRYLRESVERDPKDVRTQIDLSLALCVARRIDEALEVAERALELEPRSSAAHAQLAAVYCHMYQKDEGLRWLHKALELDPKNGEAALMIALLSQEQGDWRMTEVAAERAIESGVNDADTFCLLGYARLWLKEYAKAEEALSAALRREPGHLDALLTFSYVKAATGDIRRSRAYLRRIEDRIPHKVANQLRAVIENAAARAATGK